jgi:hypothetical protein
VSTLGIETGNMVHVPAATVGLSALLASLSYGHSSFTNLLS